MSARWCFSREENKKLIDAVSRHPIIYDDRVRPVYKSREVKNQVWETISEEVGRKPLECKSRWNNIKKTFDRRIKKQISSSTTVEESPDESAIKWWDQLSFLYPVIEAKQKSSDSDNNEDEVVAYSKQDNSDTFHDSGHPQDPMETFVKNQTVSTIAIEKHFKEMNTVIRNVLEKANETDNVLFFKSIAKSVEKMPPDFQQRAKIETLTLINKLENEIRNSKEGTSNGS